MDDDLDRADAHFHDGVAFVRRRDFQGAAAAFQAATEAWPSYGPSHNNLGSALSALGRHDEAIAAFDRALAIDPNDGMAHLHKGVSLQAIGHRDASIACLLEALKIDPGLDEAHYYLGLAYQRGGQLSEALTFLSRSIELNPTYPDVFVALGSVLMQLRAPDDAKRAFEQALTIDPSNAAARAQRLFLLAVDCDWDELEAERSLIPSLGVTGDPVPPFNFLAIEDHPERHRARSENYAVAHFGAIAPLPAPIRPTAKPKKLRIGYFSADMREHATMFLAARMFELHDRERFELHAYSYGRDEPGPMRQRAQAAFDRFNDVRDLSDRQVAEMARSDGLDIAIDLKGYTQHQRVAILAYRPAPIQISFLGYPGTLGSSFIDYLVADGTVIPGSHRSAYTEKIIFLPDSYQVNDNSRSVVKRQGRRADHGIPQDAFVFCCFNAMYKIMPAEFQIWMELLGKVENSVLWLLAGSAKAETNLRLQAADRGVDPDRLIFAPKLAPAAHLERMQFADLFLDTFNCNAHTTASDALWAGLSIVTKCGDGFAARVGASLLKAVGLDELIATNERDYAALALGLAADPERLAALRVHLESNRTNLPLFDSARFTTHVETAFDEAYDRLLQGLAPADIIVPG